MKPHLSPAERRRRDGAAAGTFGQAPWARGWSRAAVLPACIWVALCGAIGSLASGAAGLAPQPKRLRRLLGEERRAARAARGRADRLRAEYDAKYGRPDAMPPGEAQAFQDVVAAYRDAIAKGKGSEIEAYCLIRLAAVYKYRGDYPTAIAQLKAVPERFARTKYEARAYIGLGLLQLHAYRDPAQALNWFAKVRRPGAPGDDRPVPGSAYDTFEEQYLCAQLHLARCEILVGRAEEAENRYERLARRYPQYQKTVASRREDALGEAARPPAARPAAPKWSDRVEPSQLAKPVLTERTDVNDLVGEAPATASAAAAAPPGATPGRPAASAAPRTQARTVVPPDGTTTGPAGASRPGGYRVHIVVSTALVLGCLVGLIWLYRLRARKE